MFIAHIGLGLAAKKAAPAASLGVLLLASQALDVLCGLFMVTGLERMQVTPGYTRMSPLEFLSYPWSHGLFMSTVWSIAAGLLALRLYRERRIGLVVGALVFSHWILDLISHRPDLPVFFDGSPTLGLGLWDNPLATMIAEFGLFAGGLVIVLRSTRSRDRAGTWSLASLGVSFPALFLLNHFGPPPPVGVSSRLLALPILVFLFLLPWGHWIEKHRTTRAIQ